MDNNPYPLGNWLMAPRLYTETREALILQVLRLPSPSETRPRPRKGGSGGSIPSRWATVRPEPSERPQPTEEPAAASILTEGSLNDNRIKYTDMAQTKTIDLHVRLTYVVDEGREMVEEAEWENAIPLAISPNFHTKEEGVSLERVIVEYPNGAERTYIEQTGSHGVFPIVNG